jgi:hypothetical protein
MNEKYKKLNGSNLKRFLIYFTLTTTFWMLTQSDVLKSILAGLVFALLMLAYDRWDGIRNGDKIIAEIEKMDRAKDEIDRMMKNRIRQNKKGDKIK